ncbi:hypothetical protein C2E20_4092 [Micractinium conductrix]|uniref:Uncharacterized protein n=1 Tax=Micractinium conductrix TaxID=554055 RepID=A0A2P6VF09_9CHLO|nr:hypothetical protein C2E20_4092 [Micractinium conductrix]|eukprot:PSC72661.1 hypothetical protein C2E20_4092 [Micractinium conductrix]
MVGAKKASKKAREAAAEASTTKGGNGGSKAAKSRGQPKQRARDEIVPWGWEQQAKDERKKKNSERTQAEAAAKAAKEMADLGIADKPAVKKQPDAAAPAPAAAAAGDKKK